MSYSYKERKKAKECGQLVQSYVNNYTRAIEDGENCITLDDLYTHLRPLLDRIGVNEGGFKTYMGKYYKDEIHSYRRKKNGIQKRYTEFDRVITGPISIEETEEHEETEETEEPKEPEEKKEPREAGSLRLLLERLRNNCEFNTPIYSIRYMDDMGEYEVISGEGKLIGEPNGQMTEFISKYPDLLCSAMKVVFSKEEFDYEKFKPVFNSRRYSYFTECITHFVKYLKEDIRILRGELEEPEEGGCM